MILPTNGKVVIFDDKYDEVKSLLKALSKQKIPYLYYQSEDGDDLPDNPVENIRLIFLDLELVVDSKATDQNIISAIYARLSRVIEPNSNYILVYWSTKQEKYGEAVEAAFNDGLKEFKPILSISLDKIATKNSEDPIQFIIDNIKENAEDFKVLKVFSFWENLVNNSSGNLINNFVNFINKDEKWDDIAKFLLYKLAIAHGGKEVIALNEMEKIKNSFYTLNHTFIDTLESSIIKSLDDKEEEFTGVISDVGDDTFTTLINKKLLISEDIFSGDIPGSIIFVDDDIKIEKESVQLELEKTTQNEKIPAEKRDAAIANAEKKANEKNEKLNFKVLALKTNYNNIVNSILRAETRKFHADIIQNSIKIELNISPICDYAQQKMPCCRILPGLLIKKEYEIEKGNSFNYISDATISLNEVDYLFVFDFKFLYSIPNHVAKKRTSKYKLRQQLLADLQVKLGSHINRAGVLYL
ncbi:hypothetical protein [Flavobacterium aquicola]|uniref:Response receiver domain-containing protein n=1 Tax=Flavobacterium aquicola TaxID=1682742 RepID=A0A3E0E7I7_9FLAO|nr:hypothetical protein [Flavobacterium aquicola]REG92956.1 hypothetical protein C8P67_11453 [Flavobacterium aquicola]